MNLPKLDLEKFKRMLSDDVIDTPTEKRYLKTFNSIVKGVKFVYKETRDPVFHRTIWSWVKRKVFNPVGGYVDSKVNLAIEIGVKSLIAKFWWIGILVAIGIVILIGC